MTPLTYAILTPQVSLYREVLDITTYFADNQTKAKELTKSVVLASNILQVTDAYVAFLVLIVYDF